MTVKYIVGLLSALLLIQCTPKVTSELEQTISTPSTAVSPIDQSWRSSIPTPGEARKIELGSYNVFDLDNGLKVIVVENHKLPKVSYQISLNTLPILEGEQVGYVSLAGSMMSRGTSTRTKADIDGAVDQIGASLGTSATSIYASSLTKHQNTLLDLMSDVLLNPTFPEDEFTKVKTQTLSGLKSDKDDPNSIASKVASKVNYGKNHPYAEVETVETINKIELNKCKEYYQKHFKPNNAYLIIVGDITLEEAKSNAEKHFGAWKKGNIPAYSYDVPEAPAKTSVAFSNKEGAVQSVIKVTYPIDMKPGSDDALHASVMNAILGGGVFLGRLMQNLREDKAYTYGASSSISPNRLVGQFTAGASVRNEVTDSSIVEFLYEMNRIVNEPISAKDLQLAKNSMAGSFARGLESSSTLARYAKNIVKYDLAPDYYETYLQRLQAVTIADVQNIARKHIRPDNANIVVVGNQDEIVDKLVKFDGDGVIDYYDAYGVKLEIKETALPSDITAKTILTKYIDRIGGMKALQSVKTMEAHYGMNQGGMALNIDIFKKAPSKGALSVGTGAMVFQQQTFDGKKAMEKGPAGLNTHTEGDKFEEMKELASMFPQLNYLNDSADLTLKGVDNVNGESTYKVIITSKSGKKTTEYYSVKTGLLTRSIASTAGPAGQKATVTNDYADYKKVSGILYPHTMSVTMEGVPPLEMTLKELIINEDISDDLFLIK